VMIRIPWNDLGGQEGALIALDLVWGGALM
jgi:hypothetical protein